jgi:hypothetical protein
MLRDVPPLPPQPTHPQLTRHKPATLPLRHPLPPTRPQVRLLSMPLRLQVRELLHLQPPAVRHSPVSLRPPPVASFRGTVVHLCSKAAPLRSQVASSDLRGRLPCRRPPAHHHHLLLLLLLLARWEHALAHRRSHRSRHRYRSRHRSRYRHRYRHRHRHQAPPPQSHVAPRRRPRRWRRWRQGWQRWRQWRQQGGR